MDERITDIEPFYYFVIAFNATHLLVASALFVRQRNKFPVNGHKVSLTLSIGVRTVPYCNELSTSPPHTR